MLSYTVAAVTHTEATAYLSAAGATGWPAAQEAKEQAIMRGQRYIAARYNARWLTDWDNADAPEAVKHAICEAALIEAKEPGKLAPVSTPSTDKVLVGAGKLTWERVKGVSGVDGYVPRSPIIDGLLAGLVKAATSGVSFLTRA